MTSIEGVFQTLSILDEFNIQHTGRKTKGVFNPIIIESNGKSMALLGITSKKNILESQHIYLDQIALIEDETMIIDFINKYKILVDILVVLPHMGVEHVDCPADFIRLAYHDLIDKGFDLVVASHPHTIQGIEKYKGKELFIVLEILFSIT